MKDKTSGRRMKKYLKKARFEWDRDRVVQNSPDAKPTEKVKAMIRLRQDLDRKLGELSTVMYCLTDTLIREKVVLDPHVALTYFQLTDTPRNTPFYQHLTLIQGLGPGPELWVDVDYHPMKLLDLPHDAEAVGELAIGLIEEGLKKLETYGGFPHALFHEAISDFRRSGYQKQWKVVDKIIPGTKMKGRIDASASAEKTTCTLTVSYRGTPLFQHIIWEKQGSPILEARGINPFKFQDGKLLVFTERDMFRDANSRVPAESFDLAELPDVFRDFVK